MAAVPPSVEGSFLLGCTRGLQRDQLGVYAGAMAAHGDIARFRLGPPRIGLEFDAVFSPEGARQVLAASSGQYDKHAPVLDEIAHFFGHGLLVSNGELWRRHRRIAQPLFTKRAVAAHLDGIATAVDAMVARCDEESRVGRPVDLVELSTRYALDALGRTVFGEDVARAGPVIRGMLPPLGEHIARRGLAPLRSPHWLPTPANHRAERARRAVWAIADELIAERRAAPAGGSDLLSRLIEARDPDTGATLSDDEVRDEVLIFLIAGHETTAAVLAFTLHLLGAHGAAQDAVRAEVVGAGSPLAAAAGELALTTAAVHESMRLYPPAHTVVRRAVQAGEVLGYPVDAGRIMAVSIWGIHHRASVWPDPFAFDPSRFVSSGQAARSRRSSDYAHLPFAGGPRACIGEHLAMAELVAAVGALVGRYRLETFSEDPEVDVDVSLRPRSPLPCRLMPL